MSWLNILFCKPEVNLRVIAYFPQGDESGRKVSTAIFDGEKLISDEPSSTAYCFKATHWMAFPEPPKFTYDIVSDIWLKYERERSPKDQEEHFSFVKYFEEHFFKNPIDTDFYERKNKFLKENGLEKL